MTTRSGTFLLSTSTPSSINAEPRGWFSDSGEGGQTNFGQCRPLFSHSRRQHRPGRKPTKSQPTEATGGVGANPIGAWKIMAADLISCPHFNKLVA